MGFSAGGHLAARLGNGFDRNVYPHSDVIDDQSARPDFQLLMYPVITMRGNDVHAGSRQRLLGSTPSDALLQQYSMQLHVRADTPPTFLLHAADDEVVPVGNSLQFYDSLRSAGISSEMHLFPHGGHGFGTRGTAGLTTAAWPQLALSWMASQTTQPK